KETEDWTSDSNKPRIAGVSSFGFGGANAHIILEEYQTEKIENRTVEDVLICLSAKSEEQLKSKQQDLLMYLEKNPSASVSDIAYTLQVGRDAMTHRMTLVTSSVNELMSELRAQLNTGTSRFSSNQVESGAENAPIDNEILQEKDWNKLAEFWLSGRSINWKQIHNSGKHQKISLPGYPFAKTRCWYDDLAEVVSEAKEVTPKMITPELEQHQVGDEVETENLGDGIVLVRMQARSTKNMLNGLLIKSLEKTFAELEKRSDLKVVILTGYDNVFCMGGSQDVLAGIADNKQKYTDAPFVYKGLLEFKVPVITAMQGIAVGGGLVFGLYGDLVFMSEKATYSSNFMKYGFTPGMGATYIMPQK
ncbi:putative polyketide biosynthesis enoyl-CoA isomerase PksI, partial [Exaiptasia diaphana]